MSTHLEETQGRARNTNINQHQTQTTNKELHSLTTGALSVLSHNSHRTSHMNATQLSVLSYSPPLPATYYKQIPDIQNLLPHLEGKGRSKNTLIAYAKALKALTIRADLQDTKAVELAIARYQKQNRRPVTNNYKSKLCDCYNTFRKFYEIQWERPTSHQN